MSTYFADCLPKIAKIRDGSGCSFTRASFNAMTLDEFAALGDQENLQSVYARATETKMRGVQEKSIAQLLQGRMKDYGQLVKPANVPGSQSVIAPYVVKKQRHVVNAGYFQITAGGNVDPGTTTGFNNAYHWVITVQITDSPWQVGLDALERYFIPGNAVFVDSLAASGAARSAQFNVVAAYNADGGGLKKAQIVLAPNITAVGFAALTASQKAAYQPEGGIVQVGANSVSDFESHCFNDPVNNNVKLLLYWLQTMRQTQIVSDEYLKAIEAPTANEFFKVFAMLPYAEQVKQQNKLFNDRWWVSIFKGQAINQYQNSEQWQGLAGGDVGIPKVFDIDDPSCLLEYKANAIGIEPQLNACGRVYDMAGAALDFDSLREMFYQLKRHREGSNNGETVDVLPIQMDRDTANRVKTLFASKEAKQYGISYNRNFSSKEGLEFSKSTGLAVNSYDWDEAGVTLDIVADPFFSDLLYATPAAHRSVSRYMWLLDYSDIDVGITNTESRVKVYPNDKVVDDLWKCTIKTNEKQRRLESTTFTVAVNNPDRHLIVKNFSDECPKLSVQGCSVYEG